MQRLKVNEINSNDTELVQKLQKEVVYLKEILNLKRRGAKDDIS